MEALNEAQIYGRTDYRDFEGTRGRCSGQGALPQVWDATFYKWTARFSGMEVNEVRRLRDLEEENRRLKKLDTRINPRFMPCCGQL